MVHTASTLSLTECGHSLFLLLDPFKTDNPRISLLVFYIAVLCI